MNIFPSLTAPIPLYPMVFFLGCGTGCFLNGYICRRCKIKPLKLPVVELLHGLIWLGLIAIRGFTVIGICCCAAASALLVLSVVDFRTYEIPIGCNGIILAAGIVNLYFHKAEWLTYGMGFICVSGLLLLIFIISRGRAIGGGDVKLMAAAGLLLGWQQISLAFAIGCILGSVIHLYFMKVRGKDHMLAFGPYLSIGIWLSMMWGEGLIMWYIEQLRL